MSIAPPGACCRIIHIVVAINDDKFILYSVVAEADADDGADVPPAAPARVPQPLPPLQRGVLTLLLSCPQAPSEPSVVRVRHYKKGLSCETEFGLKNKAVFLIFGGQCHSF